MNIEPNIENYDRGWDIEPHIEEYINVTHEIAEYLETLPMETNQVEIEKEC